MVQKNRSVRIAFINIQSGVNASKSFLHFILSAWKYYLPHTNKALYDLASFLDRENINVLGLSELDGGSLRTCFRDQTKILAQESRLKHSLFFKCVNYVGVAKQGNGLLTNYKILSHQQHRLPVIGEPRFIGDATLLIQGKKVRFLVAHFPLGKTSRKTSFDYLTTIIKKNTLPLILMGDFNTEEREDIELFARTSGMKHLGYQKTYPSWNPTKALDHVFVNKKIKGFKLLNKTVRLSDHLPLILEINF